MVRERVDRLNRLGRDLLQRPGQYRTGQAVLEEALAFSQELLPEEGNDPGVRRGTAQLFHQVAEIYHTLGQLDKAAEAYGQQARLLRTLLVEEPGGAGLRIALAHCYRWRGNVLRDLIKAREARQAYDQAAALQDGLVRDFPQEPGYQAALANTLLNMATLLSHEAQANELEQLYSRAVQLDRAAARAAPDDRWISEKLALALGDQELFFLGTGLGAKTEAPVREALAIYQKLLAGGHHKGVVERTWPAATSTWGSSSPRPARRGRRRNATCKP
jgi:tetratricopeptide (TPR) repeat protein